MFSLSIHDQTALRLRQLASNYSTTVEDLAERAVDEFLHNEERRAMRRELDAYIEMHSYLRAKYQGKFVAIYQGKLIDSDSDIVALTERVTQNYPAATPLITPVKDEPIETFTFYSPRLAGEL